jgi:hypothetical protein
MTDITDAGPRLRAMNDALESASLRLTDAEREAIQHIVDGGPQDIPADIQHHAALRGLLDRTKDGGK